MDNDPLDKQVGGSHYKGFKIQPVEFCAVNDIGFLESQVIKYICRHNPDTEQGATDIDKAMHYIEYIKRFKYDQQGQK